MSVAVLPKPNSVVLVAPVVNGPSYRTRFVPELVAVGRGVLVVIGVEEGLCVIGG